MHQAISQLLLWAEGLLGVGWIVLMILGHTQSTSQYRTAIFFLVFHFVLSSYPLYQLAVRFSKQPHSRHQRFAKYYSMGHMGVFLFAIAVDVNNLLETVLYLPQSDNLWYGMIVLTSVALALSTMSFLWYFTLVNKHNNGSGAQFRFPLPRWQSASPSSYTALKQPLSSKNEATP